MKAKHVFRVVVEDDGKVGLSDGPMKKESVGAMLGSIQFGVAGIRITSVRHISTKVEKFKRK